MFHILCVFCAFLFTILISACCLTIVGRFMLDHWFLLAYTVVNVVK